MRQCGAAVVSQWPKQGIRDYLVGCPGEARPVREDVVVVRCQRDGASAEETGQAAVLCRRNDRVRERQRGVGSGEGPDEQIGRSGGRRHVAGDGGVHQVDDAIGDESCAAIPASGLVAADGRVDDRRIAERPDAAADIVGNIATDGTALYSGGGVKERVHTPARPSSGVVHYTAVYQVERGTITVVNAAAALPEVTSVGRHLTSGDRDMIERKRPIVEHAARQLEAIAAGHGEVSESG